MSFHIDLKVDGQIWWAVKSNSSTGSQIADNYKEKDIIRKT